MRLHLLTTLSIAAAATLTLASCGGNDGPKYGDPAVKASPSSLTYAVAGGSNAVQLTATVAWVLDGYTSDVQKWITVTPTSGDPSKEAQVITITAAANTDVERSATITFKQVDGTLKATVSVSQDAYYPEVSASTVSAVSKNEGYKYQRYELTGIVKNLKSDGTFDLVDATGSIVVSGLNASEAAYGTSGGALSNVKERDTVTIVGYRISDNGAVKIAYGFLKSVTAYTEASADDVETVKFPYTATFSNGAEKFIINNKVFPYAFDALWTNSSAEGWVANAFKEAQLYATETWLISPMIDMTGAVKPILVFNHAVQFFTDIDMAKEQTTLMMRVKGGEWTKVYIDFSYPDDLTSEVMTSENVNLADYIGSTIQIAFKYVSDETNEAGKWRVVDFSVKEDTEEAQGDNSGGAEDYNKPGWNWDD